MHSLLKGLGRSDMCSLASQEEGCFCYLNHNLQVATDNLTFASRPIHMLEEERKHKGTTQNMK